MSGQAKTASIFAAPVILWLRVGLALTFIGLCVSLAPFDASPTSHYFLFNDLPTFFGLAITLYAMTRGEGDGRSMPRATTSLALLVTLAAGLACILAGGLGTRFLFENYSFSYDEHLVDFDVQLFRHGHLMGRLPAEWRPYMPALEYLYLIRTPGYEFWSSAYLPINAAFRALADTVGLKAWLNGLWGAVTVLATHATARRLWPKRPGLWVGAIVLLFTSSQFLLMSMTAYAMPAHLALNMVWLALFLRRRAASDLAAILVGAVASGLHQVVFHPLFVAPFLAMAWLQGQRTRAAVFAAAYALIGLFWIEYPALQAHLVGFTPEAADPFVRRIFESLSAITLVNLGDMARNLLRFITWQSLATAPLFLAGVWAWRRLAAPFQALLAGMALTLIVVALIVPGQGAGWGYRYLNGFVAATALVAIEIFRRLSEDLPVERKRRALMSFAALSAISLALMLPLRAWQARQFTHPYAVAMRAIEALDADVVVLDTGTFGIEAGNFNRNRPDLSNRPKILLMANLTPELIRGVCDGRKLVIVDGRDPIMTNVQTWDSHWPEKARALRAEFARLNCGVARGKY